MYNKKPKILLIMVMLASLSLVALYGTGIIGQTSYGDSPVIENITRIPNAPTTVDNVIITCTVWMPSITGEDSYIPNDFIIAQSDIYSVTLEYDINGVTGGISTMILNNGVYKAIIPMQTSGVKVNYHIDVSTEIGNVIGGPWSYTVAGATNPPETITGNFNIYIYNGSVWNLIPVGGELSGRIRVNAQFTSGIDRISGVKLIVTKVSTGVKAYENILTGVSSGLFRIEFDTKTLPNAIYDFKIEVVDNGGAVIYTQSAFTGDFVIPELNVGIILIPIFLVAGTIYAYKRTGGFKSVIKRKRA